jgi:hypothetical protein
VLVEHIPSKHVVLTSKIRKPYNPSKKYALVPLDSEESGNVLQNASGG